MPQPDPHPGEPVGGSDAADRLRALAVAARTDASLLPELRAEVEALRVEDATALHAAGLVLAPVDPSLAARLAARALQVADDDEGRLAAHGLAARVAVHLGDVAAAAVHLPVAEHLALRAGGLWDLASLAHTRGLLELARWPADPAPARAALAAAARLYAAAGDARTAALVDGLLERAGSPEG